MQLKRAMPRAGTVLPVAPTLIVPVLDLLLLLLMVAMMMVVMMVLVMRLCALVGR